MASVLGVTALLGAMKCGAGDPPPQGDDGGSGGGVNGVSPGAKQTKKSGIGRFSVLLTMLLLVLGLAGTASAQSNASELEDGGAPYLLTSVTNVITYSVRITDTGSGNINVEVTNISAIPTVSLGVQQADDTNGYGMSGGADPELVFTDSSGDTIAVYIGTPGDDLIVSVAGYECELIFGMDGTDDITGGSLGATSRVLIFGGDGNDVILTDDGPDEIWGGFRSISYATGDSDYIEARGGNDLVFGGGDDDFIFGEAGCDDLYGGGGDDHIEGGTGEDFIRGEDGDDTLLGGDGHDAIDGGSGVDVIEGGADSDWLHDRDGVGGNSVDGGSGKDWIHVRDDNSSDSVETGSGDDVVWRDNNTGLGIVDSYNNSSGTDTQFFTGDPGGYAPNGTGTQDSFENYARATFWPLVRIPNGGMPQC